MASKAISIRHRVAVTSAPTGSLPPLAHVATDWGGPLSEADYAALEGSWISREIADAAMLRRLDAQQGREAVGQKGSRDCAGVLFPYFWPGEPRCFNLRVRRDNPDWKMGSDGKPKPDKKYLGPPKGANRLYIPPGVTPEQLADVSLPILLTEGEKKALALWRLAYHESDKPRFMPVGLAGVWNWRGVIGKATSANGARVDIKGPIPDLSRIEWRGRRVLIVFDAGVNSNESVAWARRGIARELGTREAVVELVTLPDDCGVNGVDDLLAAWGPERVLKLFENSVHASSLEVVLPPQFQSTPEGMFRTVTKGDHLVKTQLTNYQASVVTNICLDDGVETKREFEIRAGLIGRPFRFTVPAARFASLDWAIEQIGPSAITYPNQRDYARAAIQSHSASAEDRIVYTHSGWRKIGSDWAFLHTGGAIGSGGAVAGVNVRLPGALARYELRLPATLDARRLAVAASLKILELGPRHICFLLLAAAIRAVIGEADFSVHLAGATGVFKSELAALVQQFFGPGMTRVNLPGSWSSTANAIEMLVFNAKDALVVIDDFAPQGNASDVARYHSAADRVFRAVGNQSARSRLDSTARLREPKPPRGLILSTGEDIPRGQSIRARLLIAEISKGVVNPARLGVCQKDASSGFYTEALTGFLQWMAGQYDELVAAFRDRVKQLRGIALSCAAHARTPEAVAGLQAAFDLYLQYAEESGAIRAAVRAHLSRECAEALAAIADAQAKHQAESDPALRFLQVLRACLSSGQAYLSARSGLVPEKSPEGCGWRFLGGNWQPNGHCVGWVDGDHIYLEPTVSHQVVQSAARQGEEALSVSAQVLRKLLHEKGFLASTDKKRGTLMIRRTIAGSSKEVLHLLRTTLLPDDPESADDEPEVQG